MKTVLLVLAMVAYGLAVLPARSYPDLAESRLPAPVAQVEFDSERVQKFLSEWQAEGVTLSSFAGELAALIAGRNNDLRQLASIYRIQQRQTEQLEAQAKPVFAVFSDATNPLYSYSVSEDIYGTADTVWAHQMGIGTSVTQNLPTAGTVSLTAKLGSTVSIYDDDDAWTWEHEPSLGVSLRQPLGQGSGLVDRLYASKQLERQTLGEEDALDALQDATRQLVLQGSELLVGRQRLLENRWLVARQADLLEGELSDARNDLDRGLASRNDVARKSFALDRLRASFSELSNQIAGLETSLLRLYGSSLPSGIVVPVSDLARLAAYGGTGILDDQELFEAVLRSDASYRKAMRDRRIAQIDLSLGNPADSPVFSLDMSLSPYYDASEGNGAVGSFGEMLADSKPSFSVTVNFSANDLQRRSSDLSADLAREALAQASADIVAAREAVSDRLSDFQRRLNDRLQSLDLSLADYLLKANEVEVEQIRASMGAGDEVTVQTRENELYEAAFVVLQDLRDLDLLSLELDLIGGATT
jgi:hypothetical protein